MHRDFPNLEQMANLPDKKADKAKNQPASGQVNTLREQLDACEKENNLLLELSNEIILVRDKTGLRKFFTRLKGYFYFTDSVVSLIDQEHKIYCPFIADAQVHPDKNPDDINAVLA